MTSEQRLDRLERIAKLFVSAGMRARRNMRDLDEKIGILVNMQIHNEEKFKDQDDKINMLIDLQRHNEERFGTLAEAQTSTNRRLDTLIDIISSSRNGGSQDQS